MQNLKFAAAARRAERSAVRRPSGLANGLSKARGALIGGLLAIITLHTLHATAQSQPPSALPADVPYTPISGVASALYPRSPNDVVGKALIDPGTGQDALGNARVAMLEVLLDSNAIPADGQSRVQVTVRLFGADSKPLTTPATVTIEHSAGRVLLPGARTDELGPRGKDADRLTPGVQLRVEGGVAQFSLLAPAEAQEVRLRVSAGSVQAVGVVSFVPETREMIAAGLIEGVINFRQKTVIGSSVRGDGFEREIERWSRDFNGGKANVAARTAFYLKGVVRGDVLLTAAFDSDKDTRQRLLQDVRPDELYPVYGDASLRSFDARSGSKLYVRVDKNKSYLLWGDFVTGDGFTQPIGQGAVASLKQRSLGNYNRSTTGLRAHHEEGNVVGNAFAFHDTLKQVVEEFASQGSGPYRLTNNAVLEGSEKVEVITRDRYQSARIVAVRPLTRLADYSFEPFSGRILLNQFLGAYDDQLNPQSLRVSYEVDQGGTRFWTAGGDAQWRLNPSFEIGGSAVTERNPLAPYDLASANATWRIASGTALVLEVARSHANVNTNPVNAASGPGLAGRVGDVDGQAWRLELAHEGQSTQARVFLGRSDPGFDNPAAPLQGGRSEAQFSGSAKLSERVKVYGEGQASKDSNTGGGQRDTEGAGLRFAATDALSLDVGLRRSRETIGSTPSSSPVAPFGNPAGGSSSIATGSAGGALGLGSPALDPSTGLPVIGSSTLNTATSNLPVGTQLASTTVHAGAGLKLSERLSVGAEVEREIDGDARRRASIGGDYLVAERTRLYARAEHQTGWATLGGVSTNDRSANVLVAGVDSGYIRDTQLFSEYRLRDASSGRDLQLASGARHIWDLAEGVRASAGYEQLNALSQQTAPARALSFGLETTANELWRGSTRVELRRSGDLPSTPTDDTFTTTLWQVTAARKLSRDWTLLARNYLLRTDYVARGDVFQDRAQLGVAYRQTDTNRINALAKLEYKLEDDASNAAVGDLRSRAWIASAHADYHPSRPWWFTARIAGKWQQDRFEGGVSSAFRAQLVSGRVVYDVTENWDVGVLAAAQFGQYGARQRAVGAEVGYLLKQNLWLSAGVIATGFAADADLSGNDYTQRGGFIRLRFKFDETLWRGNDPAVNRSLPR